MRRIVIGLVLLGLGLYGLVWYHNALWSSGGPDSNRIIIECLVPYVVTLALAIAGLLVGWKGYRSMNHKGQGAHHPGPTPPQE